MLDYGFYPEWSSFILRTRKPLLRSIVRAWLGNLYKVVVVKLDFGLASHEVDLIIDN